MSARNILRRMAARVAAGARRALLVLAGCVLPLGAALAAGFPERAITIVVTFPPGGGTDLLARELAPVLQRALGQPVVVENRPGASGNIAARQVARSAPDGYTLLMVNSSFAINPVVFPTLDFSPTQDFAPVINVGFVPSVLVVPANSAWRTLTHLRARASVDAAPLFFASCGAGTPQHLAGEMLRLSAGLPLAQVPYKGCGPALADVMAGHVGLGIVTASSAAPLLAAGKLRALAVTSPRRNARMPDVPTVAEQGVPGFTLDQWHGLLAPAGTPPAVIQRLNQVLDRALADEALAGQLRPLGYTLATPAQRTPQAFGRLLAGDVQRFGAVAQGLSLRLD